MERLGGEDAGMPTSIRKVVVASFIGTTLLIMGVATFLVGWKGSGRRSGVPHRPSASTRRRDGDNTPAA
jgi:hypothetical protein